MDDADRLDGVCLVLAKPRLDRVGVGARAPIRGDELRLEPELRGHVFPQRREMPGLEHQDLVAG